MYSSSLTRGRVAAIPRLLNQFATKRQNALYSTVVDSETYKTGESTDFGAWKSNEQEKIDQQSSKTFAQKKRNIRKALQNDKYSQDFKSKGNTDPAPKFVDMDNYKTLNLGKAFTHQVADRYAFRRYQIINKEKFVKNDPVFKGSVKKLARAAPGICVWNVNREKNKKLVNSKFNASYEIRNTFNPNLPKIKRPYGAYKNEPFANKKYLKTTQQKEALDFAQQAVKQNYSIHPTKRAAFMATIERVMRNRFTK